MNILCLFLLNPSICKGVFYIVYPLTLPSPFIEILFISNFIYFIPLDIMTSINLSLPFLSLMAPSCPYSIPSAYYKHTLLIRCPSVGPTAVIPQYYGVHWGVYPANIIQQSGPSSQARRPLSPSQPSEVTSQSNGNLAASAAAAAAGNMQGPLSQYQVTRQT